MSDIDQIAAEAWAELFDSKAELANEKDLAIIKDAIEKVERLAHKEGYSAGLADAKRLRAAHASEEPFVPPV